jgi:hypothetical protein
MLCKRICCHIDDGQYYKNFGTLASDHLGSNLFSHLFEWGVENSGSSCLMDGWVGRGLCSEHQLILKGTEMPPWLIICDQFASRKFIFDGMVVGPNQLQCDDI